MRSSFVTLAVKLIFVQWMTAQIIFASRSPGETNPQRIELEIGGNTNITCIMNLQMFSGKDSSSLYFVEEDTGKEVPRHDLVIVNASAVVYTLHNALSQNRGYVCKSGPNAIAVSKVSVGTAPPDIEDFKCRGYDYTYMVCNFTIPQNMILTQYNLSYTALSPNYLQTCQLDIQDTQGVCKLTLDSNNYRPNYEFYNFTLTGNNSLGTKRQSFWINHYESVIPPRPEYHIEQLTDNNVVLSWHLVKYSYYKSKGLQYEIQIRPVGFDWMNHSNYEIRNNKSEFKLKLRNLPYAFYWYTVSVRMKVKTARDDSTLWSEPFVLTFQTKSRLPESPPMTDVGSFDIDSTETRLRLYWKQLAVYSENGANFEYIVKQVKRDGEEIEMLPLHIDHTSASFTWDKNHHYEFVIKSKNDVGESVGSQNIIVYPMAKFVERKSPKWIRNVYQAPNHTYTLSWIPPDDQEGLVDYTVFWCQSKRALRNECRGTIHFDHVNKNITKYVTAAQKQDHTHNLAVSANYINFNSGMHWTMCTVDDTSDLVKLEPEITPTSARSIKIQWSPERVCTSLLEGYNLTYCQAKNDLNATATEYENCLDQNITITMEKTSKKFMLTDLKPFTFYKIEIYMFSKFKRGKNSDPLIIQTFEEAPTPPRNLKFRNITSNSAWISWMSPTQVNGKLRYYTVIQNNEHHIVNCTKKLENICSNDTERELNFKLDNLSSFTNYKVYVIAHTLASSFPSNDIHFKTLIGIPSNPRHMAPDESNHTVIQWSKPEVPSGRIEFYEVAVIVWHKDKIQRRRISGIIGATSCVLNEPVCLNTDYKNTLQVRAVNVAALSNEVDQQVFAASNNTEEEDEFDYETNDDLKCIGTSLTEAEQRAIIERYRNTHKYKQYKSVWEKGPIYGCAATTKMSKMMFMSIIMSLSFLVLVGAYYYARKTYIKMANIDYALPPGLASLPYPKTGGVDNAVIEKEDEEFNNRSRECLYNNEKHGLLSTSSDSGYLCGGGGVGGMHGGVAAASIGKSSGYVGSDRSEDYCHNARTVTKGGSDETQMDAYMVMQVLTPHAAVDLAATNSKPTTLTDDGYIKANATDSYLATKTVIPNFQSSNGYIKPNKLFNWQPDRLASVLEKPLPPGVGEIAVNSSGYVQPQMLQKNINQPPFDGYTTLDALGKPTLINAATSPQTFAQNPAPPPISGYVTHKELSAFGHQKLS